jgi:hypothetical protein
MSPIRLFVYLTQAVGPTKKPGGSNNWSVREVGKVKEMRQQIMI